MSNSPVYTISEFCAAEKISRAKLYGLWAEGRGPRYFRLGENGRRRITEHARQDWHKELEAQAATTTPISTATPTKGGG